MCIKKLFKKGVLDPIQEHKQHIWVYNPRNIGKFWYERLTFISNGMQDHVIFANQT